MKVKSCKKCPKNWNIHAQSIQLSSQTAIKKGTGMSLCTPEQQDKFITANSAALLSSIQTAQVCEDKYTQLEGFCSLPQRII